ATATRRGMAALKGTSRRGDDGAATRIRRRIRDVAAHGDRPPAGQRGRGLCKIVFFAAAGVAELADAHGSGPCWLRLVWVQVPPPAPPSEETQSTVDSR